MTRPQEHGAMSEPDCHEVIERIRDLIDSLPTGGLRLRDNDVLGALESDALLRAGQGCAPTKTAWASA